jgi:hypothetical protein
MNISSKILLLLSCFPVFVVCCPKRSTSSLPTKAVNKTPSERDLIDKKWLKIDELIKYGEIKDSADFMNQVNTIMSVDNPKRTSFVDQTSSVDASGLFQAEIRMLPTADLKLLGKYAQKIKIVKR